MKITIEAPTKEMLIREMRRFSGCKEKLRKVKLTGDEFWKLVETYEGHGYSTMVAVKRAHLYGN